MVRWRQLWRFIHKTLLVHAAATAEAGGRRCRSEIESTRENLLFFISLFPSFFPRNVKRKWRKIHLEHFMHQTFEKNRPILWFSFDEFASIKRCKMKFKTVKFMQALDLELVHFLRSNKVILFPQWIISGKTDWPLVAKQWWTPSWQSVAELVDP